MGVVSQPSDLAVGDWLSDEEISLLTGESEGYVFRFKSIELWEQLRETYFS